jgi:hypothetical protein
MQSGRQSRWTASADGRQGGDATDRAAHLSRRAFLGTGAAAAAVLSLGRIASADAAPARFDNSGKPSSEVPFGPVTVTNASGGSYARAVRLSEPRPGTSRTFLATYQQFGSPGFPIFRSDDDGRTWQQVSNVPASGEAAGVWLQPFLYELPRAFAGLPKGALLCAGNSLDHFSSTTIMLYASTDRGLTWQFLSTVAEGGPPVAQNGFTPVWEPFLLLHRDRLICYYSDQRDPNYGQKLAHQTSTDLRQWGPVVNDAVGTDYSQRPGMTTVAQVKHDLWIMTYEFGVSATYYPVRYKLARDPEQFASSPALALLDQDGYAPSSAPVVSWTDSGGPMGTIFLSANSDQDFFLNRALGDPRKWTRLSSTMPRGYSRFAIPLESPGSWHRPGLAFVVTGPPYGEQAPIQAGVVSLS